MSSHAPSSRESVCSQQAPSRREFLSQTFALGAGALIAPATVPALAGPHDSVNHLVHVGWGDMVGDRFCVHGAPFIESEQTATLVLRRAVRHEYPPGTKLPARVSPHGYSLDFVLPRGEPLENATYRFSHPKLGRFLLFIHQQRRPSDSTTSYYQAVIN